MVPDESELAASVARRRRRVSTARRRAVGQLSALRPHGHVERHAERRAQLGLPGHADAAAALERLSVRHRESVMGSDSRRARPLSKQNGTCNSVQSATATLALTATSATKNLQPTESQESYRVRIPPSPPNKSNRISYLRPPNDQLYLPPLLRRSLRFKTRENRRNLAPWDPIPPTCRCDAIQRLK